MKSPAMVPVIHTDLPVLDFICCADHSRLGNQSVLTLILTKQKCSQYHENVFIQGVQTDLSAKLVRYSLSIPLLFTVSNLTTKVDNKKLSCKIFSHAIRRLVCSSKVKRIYSCLDYTHGAELHISDEAGSTQLVQYRYVRKEYVNTCTHLCT